MWECQTWIIFSAIDICLVFGSNGYPVMVLALTARHFGVHVSRVIFNSKITSKEPVATFLPPPPVAHEQPTTNKHEKRHPACLHSNHTSPGIRWVDENPKASYSADM